MLEVQIFFQKIHFYQAESHLNSTDTRRGILKYIAIREVGIRLNKDTHAMSPYYVIFVTCDNVTRKIGRCVENFDNTTYRDFEYLRQFCDAWHVTKKMERGV